MTSFDPNAASPSESGVFGLPHAEADAKVVLVPVPFDATTSYRKGTAEGPWAILEASRQVDLFDLETGRPYAAGIYMSAECPEVSEWNVLGRAAAAPVIAAAGVIGDDAELARSLAEANDISKKVDDFVYARTRQLLEDGKIVGIVGGDHAVPFGALRAHAERYPGLGILHFDAHADLRPAYEGFVRSHASIMYNVLHELPQVSRIVQVGVRDFSEEEFTIIRESHGRVVTHFDADLRRERRKGITFDELAERIIEKLPREVYVSFDIDGLVAELCPHTGTPVPGGLAWDEALAVVEAVVRSGRTIVGFDVVEVAPGPDDDWDANVGARLLYKLIGFTLVSRGISRPIR